MAEKEEYTSQYQDKYKRTLIHEKWQAASAWRLVQCFKRFLLLVQEKGKRKGKKMGGRAGNSLIHCFIYLIIYMLEVLI